MAARSLLLTGPVTLPSVTDGSLVGHLGALVAADVLVRRALAEAHELPWVGVTLSGGLAGQHATEVDLVRSGLDRAHLGRKAFVHRMGELVAEGHGQLATLVSGLGLGLDMDATLTAGEAVAGAARTAFVRLFDAGLVVEAERIVAACPRCATTVAAADAVPADLDGEALTLRLSLLDAPEGPTHLDVRCLAAELLPGVVAVAVPEGSPCAGTSALVPVAASVVPVVVDASVGEPTLVVPAHDPVALTLARRLGLSPVPVLGADGAVSAPGPLAGLARYAARAAARQLLDAEGAMVAAAEQLERAERCPACHTTLVPLLGRQWFLAMTDLETAAADAVRDGRLAVWPATARDELLAGTGAPAEWCVSQQVWGGVPMPVGRCRDCGHADVSVNPAVSCRRCMGDLVPATDVLDTRFVRSMWPLVAVGWPVAGRGTGDSGAGPALLVVPAEVADEILPMVALGLRLAGAVPFDEVAFVAPSGGVSEPDEASTAVDLSALVAQEGSRVMRVALVCGGLDVTAARDLVARLDDPPLGSVDVDRLSLALDAAFAAVAPAAGLGMLAAAVGEGVPAADADRVRALAAPFVGE